ncbi:RsmB/NOP family class I SAM-dependent RNA methyltransferase [Rhodobacter sp. NTK016B]|uniref:RsmB/NOP family class I SAM-dependent RNA methyltransferase n=1 Tax=Rhodobacter sp. NTK016B TaxID=2759676 RepID=UPI001A8EAD66|nr:RsmB/NOP family class I SAM-dependent RNA methyltransferase [Rhodobacter sp. NTK016B]MBN8291538.1 RsmB/NOP family class I SAM-dependent RNA methyltransferase [Rhodobacter sp. NTK016B]
MTPAAREAAAMILLDRWLEGQPLEAALTNWARASRFAGSGDREAVRDLVFQAVRRRRSAAALGQGETGRAMLLGLARAAGRDLSGWNGEGHAPSALTDDERALLAAPVPDLPRGVGLDCPDWLLPAFDAALGDQADDVLRLMQDRAPVFLRVNRARSTPEKVARDLAGDGIETRPHPLAETALEVTAHPRRLRNAKPMAEGEIELQDVASQAVALAFARQASELSVTKVLDYCAGGGGKSLALAAEGLGVSAHDIDPRRMADLPARAKRAGATIRVLQDPPTGAWPAIFADAPCSGSGSWRRAPEAKWAFTAERLDELQRIQDSILDRCAELTAPGGILGYATCSLFRAEDEERVAAFLQRQPGWQRLSELRLSPLDGGDGFFLAVLRKA